MGTSAAAALTQAARDSKLHRISEEEEDHRAEHRLDQSTPSKARSLRSGNAFRSQDELTSKSLESSFDFYQERLPPRLDDDYSRLNRSSCRSAKLAPPPPGLANHVIVCGEHESVDIFVKALRKKYLSRVVPVVVLSEAELCAGLRWRLAQFPRVYFVPGSPLSKHDLKACQVKYADKAVVYSKLDSRSTKRARLSKDHRTVLIYNSLLSVNRNLQVFLEVIDHNSVALLNDYSHFSWRAAKTCPQSAAQRRATSKSLPSAPGRRGFSQKELLAAGRVALADVMDRLTAQAYYNPQIVGLFNLLLDSDTVSASDDDRVSELVLRELGVVRNVLVQVAVPQKYLYEPYRKLFLYLIAERNMVALGLYRWLDQAGPLAQKRATFHLRQPRPRDASHAQRPRVRAHQPRGSRPRAARVRGAGGRVPVASEQVGRAG